MMGHPVVRKLPALRSQDHNTVDDDDDVMTVPDDEQMEQIKALEGKDINPIYEEQERRRRRATDTTNEA